MIVWDEHEPPPKREDQYIAAFFLAMGALFLIAIFSQIVKIQTCNPDPQGVCVRNEMPAMEAP